VRQNATQLARSSGYVQIQVIDFAALLRPKNMILYNRKYLTAWLGLIAMWLIVFAPMVSQLVASARADEPVAALCSAEQPSTPDHHTAHDSLDACGYCSLLAHHVAAPPLPPVALFAFVVLSSADLPVLNTRFTPLGAFPSGRPRGPPAVS
jgi:hypothetical protein